MKEPSAFAGGRDGESRWWLAPEGKLKPCSEHEYAARAILRGLNVTPATGRGLYEQMFNHGWVRVVREKSRILYETSRSLVVEANQIQTRSMKALAVECGVGLYNATANKIIALERVE